MAHVELTTLGQTSLTLQTSENDLKLGSVPATRRREVHGSVISCHNINYNVKVPDPNRRFHKINRQIITDVSGVFTPGLNAIMGPTGGGKTSLLDILAGRKDPHGLSGTVLVDGFKQPKNFKCMTGYVVQDDVVMGTLTVRENFMFSANLRLDSKEFSQKRKVELVQETIEELGLSNCADSKVGTEFIRGVSGGERKRTNIGMELIISPKVLFLDEPTTGLDASTANAVVGLLKEISRRGRTVIFSIHQPRYTIFREFDRLMLLSAGKVAYHGPADDALEFFISLGHEYEEHDNPPDFFLDVINGDLTLFSDKDTKPLGDVVKEQKDEDSASIPPPDYDDDDDDNEVTKTTEINDHDSGSSHDENIGNNIATNEINGDVCEAFIESKWNKQLRAELEPIWKVYEKRGKNDPGRPKGGYATSFPPQLFYLSKRALMNIARNPATTVLQIAVMIFFSLVIGGIFFQLDLIYPYAIQNRVGAMFFIIMSQVFGNLSAVELFIKERKIFIHESASGFYRVSSYFFAKLFCDILPMRIVPLVFFAVITYFMIGFQITVSRFFIFFLNLFLTTMAASALGFAISAAVNVFAIANTLIALCYVIMMVFGGFLVNLDAMAVWLSWIQYLSIVRYSLNTLSINEMYDQTYYYIGPGDRVLNLNNSMTNYGTEYLADQGIPHENTWDLWQNQVALAAIALVLFFLSYIQLRRIKKLT